MSYAEVIHDLAGEKDKQWLILRREAYEQAAKADAEIAALRAECARKDAAISDLLGAQDYLEFNDRHPNKDEEPEWGVDPAEFQSKWQASIDEARAALNPSDAGKRYAAMERLSKIMADAQVTLHDDHVQVSQLDPEELFAALRELEK